jgi:hypothetical protein
MFLFVCFGGYLVALCRAVQTAEICRSTAKCPFTGGLASQLYAVNSYGPVVVAVVVMRFLGGGGVSSS